MNIATAALFLAAKVEEQPRKLEHVARVSYAIQNRDAPNLDTQSETYTKLIEDITYHELLILETLGFEVAVEQPHPHVVKCTQLIGVSRDLSQTAYFMAHNSLLLTTFCLEHRPTVVACVGIHLAYQWKGLEIPLSQDNKNWWEYIDHHINLEQLNEIVKEFLEIFGKCPTRLQKKITEPMRLAQQQTMRSRHGESSGHHSNIASGSNSSQKGKGTMSGSGGAHAPKHKIQGQTSHHGQTDKHRHQPMLGQKIPHHSSSHSKNLSSQQTAPSKVSVKHELPQKALLDGKHHSSSGISNSSSNKYLYQHQTHSYHHSGHMSSSKSTGDLTGKHHSAVEHKHRQLPQQNDAQMRAAKRPHPEENSIMRKKPKMELPAPLPAHLGLPPLPPLPMDPAPPLPPNIHPPPFAKLPPLPPVSANPPLPPPLPLMRPNDSPPPPPPPS